MNDGNGSCRIRTCGPGLKRPLLYLAELTTREREYSTGTSEVNRNGRVLVPELSPSYPEQVRRSRQRDRRRIAHRNVEEVRRAGAVGGAETGDDDLGAGIGLQGRGPFALQVRCRREPDRDRIGVLPEIIDVPADGAVAAQVPAHAGPQTPRSPGAADITIGPWRERVLAQGPDGAAGGVR